MNISIDINGDAKEIAALIDQLKERPAQTVTLTLDKEKIAKAVDRTLAKRLKKIGR